MIRSFTNKDNSILAFCLTVSLLLFLQQNGKAQISYVNANALITSENAINATNATIFDNSFTTLNSYGGSTVGIGNYSGKIELEFPSQVPVGKTTYLKLDFDQDILNALIGGNLGSSLANLSGSVSLVNHYFTITTKNNTTPITTFSSQNSFTDNSGKLIKDAYGNFYFAITSNLPYDRIEITDNTNSALLGTSNSMKVYYAFYTSGTDSCANPFSTSFDGTGNTLDTLGLGATFINHPESAIDTDLTSYSHLSLGNLTVGGTISQTIYFNSISLATDQIQIKLKLDNPSILNSGLSDGIKIEVLNGTNLVYTLDLGTINDSDLLEILSNGQIASIPIIPEQSFDKIKITLSTLTQLNTAKSIRIYDVKKSVGQPSIAIESQNISICRTQSTTLSAQTESDNELLWYDSNNSTIPVAITSYDSTFTTPILNTSTSYYVAARKRGCSSISSRLKFNISVLNSAPNNSISSILINSDVNTTICNINGNIVLTAQTNNTLNISNPIFYWYTLEGINQVLLSGQNANTLQLSGLSPGTYTYFVGISCDEFCQTMQQDRKSITFTIQASTLACNYNANNIQICLGNDAIIKPTSTLSNPVFNWYFSNDYSEPIPNGTVNGITYTISPSGQLTISGLTTIGNPYVYFLSMSSDKSCPNEPGTFKIITVYVNETLTPTTQNTIQYFCQSSSPTIASIQVNEQHVFWYDAPIDGNSIAPNTPLTNGMIYYAGITNPATGCSSKNRLAITAYLNVVPTPTTKNTNQYFCQPTPPTVASLQVNETNVMWYYTPNSNFAIDPTTPLINGMTYYAEKKDPVTGCTSINRLAVKANLNATPPPTTDDDTQNFCLSSNPTVASLQVNENNVVWYNAPVGGVILDPSTPLADGIIYYGSITDTNSGCISVNRLAVSANLNSTQSPTTNSTIQNFCQSNNPTIASLQINENNVTWYDALTGGNVIPSNTLLINDMFYFASITDPITGCPSTKRLAIKAILNSGATPTTNNTTQFFCKSNNPTVASLQVNENNIVWYDSPNGTTIITPNTLLIDNKIYYASMSSSNSGCKSANRLAITAKLNSGQTPTTIDNTQEFCKSINPTVALLQVNENNVVWYDAPYNGNSIPYSTPLVDGMIYYASINDSTTGCTTTSRLAVTVHLTTPNSATIDDNTDTTCDFEPVTYTTETNMMDYVWEIGSGGQIISGGGNNDSTVTINWTQLGSNIVKVSYKNPASCNEEITAAFNLTVESCVLPADACLTVFNEFTPNGDGSNEYFYIVCAENYPNNKLEIFNRYGNLVYKTKGYKNDWKGIANVNGTFNDNILPTGTYYYIFETGDNTSNQAKSGWLYIMR